MQQPSLRLGDAIATAWQAFIRYPGLTIGGFLLYGIITAGAGMVPFLGFLASIVLSPPMQGGLYILFLNIVDNRNPDIGDLFRGFRAFGKWMGIYWLYCAIVVGAFIPLGLVAIPMGYVFSTHRPSVPPEAVPALAGAAAAIAIAYLAGVAWLLIRWALVYLAGVERAGVLEAFYHSAEITRGRRLQLLWFLFVLSLLSVSGVLALVIGLIVTLPLSMLAQAALYRQLVPPPPPPPQALQPAPELAPPPPAAPETTGFGGEQGPP